MKIKPSFGPCAHAREMDDGAMEYMHADCVAPVDFSSVVDSSVPLFLSTIKSENELSAIFSSVKLCVQRSDSTWPLICLARALVIGPSGITDVGVTAGVTVEVMSSSPGASTNPPRCI